MSRVLLDLARYYSGDASVVNLPLADEALCAVVVGSRAEPMCESDIVLLLNSDMLADCRAVWAVLDGIHPISQDAKQAGLELGDFLSLVLLKCIEYGHADPESAPFVLDLDWLWTGSAARQVLIAVAVELDCIIVDDARAEALLAAG